MDKNELYRDIARRTNGEIYIGVVGPVRTGKSTFIKRFMDVMVIPSIHDENVRARLTDELPQSAAGRTIMTTQPRFIPNEAATLEIESMRIKIRMADCVGYMVEGAVGHVENNAPRMVRTPWFDYDIPFEDAAEIAPGLCGRGGEGDSRTEKHRPPLYCACKQHRSLRRRSHRACGGPF